jgi:hypothetical protein
MGSKVLRLSLAGAMALVFGISVCTSSPEAGVLEGQLKILPQKGVDLADGASTKDEKVPCEDCPLVVLSKDGRSEIVQITTDKEGGFRVGLPAGEYILDLKGPSRHRLRATPKPFTIGAGQTVRVDMDVETGINVMRLRYAGQIPGRRTDISSHTAITLPRDLVKPRGSYFHLKWSTAGELFRVACLDCIAPGRQRNAKTSGRVGSERAGCGRTVRDLEYRVRERR